MFPPFHYFRRFKKLAACWSNGPSSLIQARSLRNTCLIRKQGEHAAQSDLGSQWEDDSVSRVPATQAWVPEFGA